MRARVKPYKPENERSACFRSISNIDIRKTISSIEAHSTRTHSFLMNYKQILKLNIDCGISLNTQTNNRRYWYFWWIANLQPIDQRSHISVHGIRYSCFGIWRYNINTIYIAIYVVFIFAHRKSFPTRIWVSRVTIRHWTKPKQNHKLRPSS